MPPHAPRRLAPRRPPPDYAALHPGYRLRVILGVLEIDALLIDAVGEHGRLMGCEAQHLGPHPLPQQKFDTFLLIQLQH